MKAGTLKSTNPNASTKPIPRAFTQLKLDGEIVGTLSLVKYSPDFCFEGLYIVKPKVRGRGIGRQIQQFALDAARRYNMGLDGVVAMQQQYERHGFKVAYYNTRYAGTAQAEPMDRCLPIKPQNLSEIAAYDQEIFTINRTRFLECWLFQRDATSLMVKDISGNIRGYGTIRKCMQGNKIGPLFSNDKETAEILFDGLATTVSGDRVYLDTPQPNRAAVALAKRNGMEAVFSTVRMYSKAEPKMLMEKIFGVTSFELG